MQQLAPTREVPVQRAVRRAVENAVRVEMVLQVFPHAWQMVHGGHALVGQQRGIAYARMHQQRRRAESARGHNHFAPGLGLQLHPRAPIGHTHRLQAVEQQPGGLAMVQNVQVAPGFHRLQKGMRGAVALACADIELQHAGTRIALRAIEVGVGRDARLRAGRDKISRRRVHVAGVDNAELAAQAAPAGVACRARLYGLEVRQHIRPGPAAHAELRPFVVVLRLAAPEHHAVDQARAAQPLAARRIDAPVVQLLFRLGLEAPVVRPAIEHLGGARRHPRPQTLGMPAGLQQQHFAAGVGREPVGQHAAGRAAAHNDVVEHHASTCAWLACITDLTTV